MIQGSKRNKRSIRVEYIRYKTERRKKGKLTEYLWQSDKFIVVRKAAKAVVARDLVIADLHGEKQPERE